MCAQTAENSCEPLDLYDDPVALLQQEIVRLEEELRLREEAAATSDRIGPDADFQTSRIAGLVAELAERDEMIQLLQDQTRYLEESLTADRAEREQLGQWLDEMESRLDSGDTEESSLRVEPAHHEDNQEKDDWEAIRQAMQAEVDRLRSELAAARQTDEASSQDRWTSIQTESLGLAEKSRELTTALVAAANEIESLRPRLAAAQAELEATRTELVEARAELERARERSTSLQSVIRDSVTPPQEPSRDLSPNERMRALREHLREIQLREEEERRNRSLSARLARLWQRSGPGR